MQKFIFNISFLEKIELKVESEALKPKPFKLTQGHLDVFVLGNPIINNIID